MNALTLGTIPQVPDITIDPRPMPTGSGGGGFFSNFDLDKVLGDIQNIANVGSEVYRNFDEVRRTVTGEKAPTDAGGSTPGGTPNQYIINPNQQQASMFSSIPAEVKWLGLLVAAGIGLKKFNVI